jgi:hypothetical protein
MSCLLLLALSGRRWLGPTCGIVLILMGSVCGKRSNSASMSLSGEPSMLEFSSTKNRSIVEHTIHPRPAAYSQSARERNIFTPWCPFASRSRCSAHCLRLLPSAISNPPAFAFKSAGNSRCEQKSQVRGEGGALKGDTWSHSSDMTSSQGAQAAK